MVRLPVRSSTAPGAEDTLAQATNDLIAANEPAVLNELDIVPTKNVLITRTPTSPRITRTIPTPSSSPCVPPLSSPPSTPLRSRCLPRRSPTPRSTTRSRRYLNYRATFEDVEGAPPRPRLRLEGRPQGRRERRQARGRGPHARAVDGQVPAEFKRHSLGAKVGDVRPHLDRQARGRRGGTRPYKAKATVKGIKRPTTPELDDEFAKPTLATTPSTTMSDVPRRDRRGQEGPPPGREGEPCCVEAVGERLQLDEIHADYQEAVFNELGQEVPVQCCALA